MKSEGGYKIERTPNYTQKIRKRRLCKHFKSDKLIGRIFIPQLHLQGCKLVCLVGNPNEHFDKSYYTERCREVDHVEYSNRQSLNNIIDAVQPLQSLMVKHYHLTICRICLVVKHHETVSFRKT